MTRTSLAVVAALLAASAAPARAAEYLAEGTKLVIKDTKTARRLVYVTKDPSIGVPIAASPDDPTVVGVTFTVRSDNVGGSERAQLALPASGWTMAQTSAGPLFRFTNRRAPAGPSAVRAATIRAGVVKVKAMTSGITLDEPIQSHVAVRLDVGTSRWCSNFWGNAVKNDPGIFKAKAQHEQPAACASPTTTTTSSSTTSSSTTTLQPSICGNGVIEAGEQCDADDLCSDTCTIVTSACCQGGELPGPVCSHAAPALLSDSGIYYTCVMAGGIFVLGGHPSDADTCPGAPAGEPWGPCEIDPLSTDATLCCEEASACSETTVTDTSEVSWFVRDCALANIEHPTPVVIGTCGSGGRCLPAH